MPNTQHQHQLPAMSADRDDVSDSDEEEEECRVCRGPAEEGRPLFKPCRCSGSIGLTHQDCLTSWLDVTHGGGRCELCSTRFRFAPQYADGTPDRLSPSEVVYRILRRLGAKWLPRGLRALFAAFLWLVILPLSTSYIFHGWMIRPSEIPSRWRWELAKLDIVGGAVIAVIIVVSFLSLMSFAEFLRFQWGGAQQQQQQQQQQQRQRAGDRQRNGGNGANNDRVGGGRGVDIEGEIDEINVHFDRDDDVDEEEEDPLAPFLNHLMANDEDSVDNYDYSSESENDDAVDRQRVRRRDANGRFAREDDRGPMDNFIDVNNDDDDEAEEDHFEMFMRAQEEQAMMDEGHHHDNRNPLHDPLAGDERAMPDIVRQRQQIPQNEANPRQRVNARFEPQFEPLQPAFADADAIDDGPDLEINIALDELLGFRGPLLALIRNLLWLLVFNTAYLGVFAFAPSKFGGSMCVILLKIIALIPIRVRIPQTIIDLRSHLWDGFITSMQELDRKSKETNMIYQPSQIARMGLGYLALSVLIFLLKAIITIIVRLRESRAATPGGAHANERNRGGHVHFMDGIQDGHELEREVNRNNRDQDVVGRRLLGVFECAAAIAKVVTLLLIKMLFLPLLLGIWLDLATLALFEKNWSDRVDYAGSDIVGSIFLHWVIGITFMLLVTVSVLQMREVAHPDILARVIKPQEPQPDLLGNLLRESGSTHTKRVLLSLGIYAILLAIHIWLPARLMLANNLGKYLPLFQPKFWHIIMPQIQVPAELFIFHLCMLGVLEKYKNKIGEMQHHWLLLMGDHLGMTNQLLPREVDRFLLVGALPVFVRDALPSQLEMSFPDSLEEEPLVKHSRDDILPLWSKLLSEPDPTKREDLIRTNISWMVSPEVPSVMQGIVHKDGKKYLSSHSYIRIPPAQTSNKLGEKTPKFTTSDLLPTCIGPYRLKQSVSHNGAKAATIEVWREVFGKPIPRPPEGWDDLGVGGAERHGRWAWGDEQTSEVENSVAVRAPFFNAEATKQTKMYTLAQLTAKSLFLVFVSWTAISVGVCAVLNAPLVVGRFSMHLLRIPEECIHDPLAFAIGVIPLIPVLSIIAKVFASSDCGFRGVLSLVRHWYRSFKPHHTSEKVRTLMLFFGLWLVICPMLLGFLYCRFVVSINGDSLHWYDYCQFALSDWGTGTLLLNLWAIMCYFEMFTKRFWTDLVLGDGVVAGNDNQGIEPQGDANDPARNAGRREQNDLEDVRAVESNNFAWQGKHGAIALAVDSLKAVTWGREWDKVNKQTLLQDCALPVVRHLVVACAVPIMAIAIIESLVNTVGSRLRSTAIFRTFAIATILVDFVLSSQQYLRHCFQAAHTIARDDRYLVGEILLNYSSQQFHSTST